METFPEFSQIQSALISAQTIYLVLPEKLTFDKVAASLAFYLSLKKTGKKVSLFCNQPMTVEFSTLVGVDKINSQLSGNNLTISFDIEESTQSVSYDIKNNKRLEIYIKPKEGASPLDYKKVKYSYTGAQVDLVFTMGAANFDDLGEIYQKNKDLFEKGKVVSLDISPQTASLSEVVASLISSLKLPIDEDIAGNLLKGIEKATDSFASAKVSPLSFEAAAFCLRTGAKRKKTQVDLKPMPLAVSAQKPPEEKEEQPAPDWMAPKIYKGNTLI